MAADVSQSMSILIFAIRLLLAVPAIQPVSQRYLHHLGKMVNVAEKI